MHNMVVSLQDLLVQTFPTCTDLSQFGDRGFTPHLSLGQFEPRRVEQFVNDELKSGWETIEFDVRSVDVISRRNADDPFAVRKSIPLVDDSDAGNESEVMAAEGGNPLSDYSNTIKDNDTTGNTSPVCDSSMTTSSMPSRVRETLL